MPTARDPRPLTGEPLALDLLNTRWNSDGVTQDLLADTDGLAVWLASNGLAGAHPVDAETLHRLRTAREALKAAVDGSPEQAAPLVDAVLEHGRIRAPAHRRRSGRGARVRRPVLGPGLARRPELPGPAHPGPGADPHLRRRRLHPALLRHVPERHPPLVLDGRVRQPGQGVPALRAFEGELSESRPIPAESARIPSRVFPIPSFRLGQRSPKTCPFGQAERSRPLVP